MSRSAPPSTSTHPLLSTTFILHRLAPLHNFPSLKPSDHPSTGRRVTSPFKHHERALTNLLKGEVLRGVNIGASSDGDNNLSKLGRLRGCKWRLLPTLSAHRDWIIERESWIGGEEDNDKGGVGEDWALAAQESADVLGVEIMFDYERGGGGCVAYLLGRPPQYENGQKDKAGAFTSLPLLLTRLPTALVDVLTGYLAQSFDTLVTPMEAGSGWIEGVLEKYLGEVEHRRRRGTGKDITLSFRTQGVGTGVKIVTVGIHRGDIADFLNKGKIILAGDDTPKSKRKRDEGPAKPQTQGPFMAAVEKYMGEMMGIYPGKLRLTKVACGGFVVGGAAGQSPAVASGAKEKSETEATGSAGRVKIFPPRRHIAVDDDEDEEDEEDGDADGRMPEEVAVERFLDAVLQLAGKSFIATTRDGESGSAAEKRRRVLPVGKAPAGRAGR